MQNEELLNEVQRLLEGMERRAAERFEGLERRIDSMERRIGVVAGLLESLVPAIQHFLEYTDRSEAEFARVNRKLRDMQERIQKLEGGAA